MNRKLLIIFGVIALIAGLAVAGCFVENEGAEDEIIPEPAYVDSSGATLTGTKTGSGSAADYSGMGDTTVKLTLSEGIITKAEITGGVKTCTVIGGSTAIPKMEKYITDHNSVVLDALSSVSALTTKETVKKAGKLALKNAGADVK